MIEPGQCATLEIVGDGTPGGTFVKLTGEDGQQLGVVTYIDFELGPGEPCTVNLEVADVALTMKVPVTVVSVGKPEPLLEEDLAKDPEP